MNNCRLIELKDSFNTNYLESLGGLKVVFSSQTPTGFSLGLRVKNMSKLVKVVSTNTQMSQVRTFENPFTEFTIPDSGHSFYFWPNGYNGDKDCFINIVDTGYILDCIWCSTPLRLLHQRTLQQLVDYCGGSPKELVFGYNLNNPHRAYNDICNKGVTGDLSVLNNIATLTTLHLYQENVTGDIVNLGKSTSLAFLYLFGTQCYGTIESLAEAQIANGRTSGTLELNGNGIITYNGVAIPAGFANKKTITFSNGSYTVA